MKCIVLLLLILLFNVNGFFLNNYYHDGFAVRLYNNLNDGGFTNTMNVYSSEPLKERRCVVHYADSKTYVNYDPKIGGKNTGYVFHDALGPMESFQIGDFEGALPVIQDEDFIESFGLEGVDCVIGMGAGNLITNEFRITPHVWYDKESIDQPPISCNLVTNELCSFNVDVSYNATGIASDVKIIFTSIYPYTLIPENIFNQIF